MLVRHYERSPVVLMWFQSILECSIILALLFFFPFTTTWTLWYFIAGITAYAGVLFFIFTLDRVDVSMSNVAWAFLSIFVSAAGIALLHERLSALQLTGAAIVLVGAFMLAYSHRHVSVLRTTLILAFLGLLYTPLFVIQKAALLRGETFGAVFLLPLLIQKGLAFLFPLTKRSYRNRIAASSRHFTWLSVSLYVLAVITNVLAFWTSTWAYRLAPASLVSMTLNTQPFMIMFLAWCVSLMFPQIAAKELLTKQSIGIKIASFTIVFLGLALLALPS